MPRSITVFADDDIAGLLDRELTLDGRFQINYRASSYSDCFEPSLKNGAKALILQMKSPIAYAQNLNYELEMANYFPAMLMFERCGDRQLRYVITDTDLIPLSSELADAFERAVGAGFECSRVYYRTTVWNENTEPFAQMISRQEALMEILRGCSSRELDIHRKKYGLDLKDSGYYLFFWELNYVEYIEHRSYKDIYNIICDVLRRECREILQSYNGGEIFNTRINQLCIFINDFSTRSEAKRRAKFEEMIGRLAAATGAKKATRYLSRRISDSSYFHLEYKRYMHERSKSFFLRDAAVMRSSMLTAAAKPPDNTELNAKLDRIGNYLRYDIQNPEFIDTLHSLFFDTLKPAMDFPAYYYCVSVISHYISKLGTPLDSSDMSDPLNPSLLRYSSIEDQYSGIVTLIKCLSSQPPYRRQTKSSLVMKAIEYIQANYRENLTVADVSQALYISSTHLSQVFKSMLGISLIQYLINYRIDQAKKILEETDLMVYTVADMVGFRDVRHFSKTFRKGVGMSPTEYRRMFSGKKE